MAQIKMIVKIKMERDEARAIQNFFQYWHLLCNSKLKHPDSRGNIGYQISWLLMSCLLQHAEHKFLKRLNSLGQRFVFSFTNAEAGTIYFFLMSHPIPEENFWLMTLRQRLIDILQSQIFKR